MGPAKCGEAARAAARRLPSVMMLPPVGGSYHRISRNMTPSLGTGTDIAEKLSHSAQAKKGLLSKGSNGTHLFPALGLKQPESVSEGVNSVAEVRPL